MRSIRTPFVAALALGVLALGVLALASCGDDDDSTGTGPEPPPNQAPAAVGSIAAVEVGVGEDTVTNVVSNFNDPDGDALTYAAATSNAGIATVATSGSQVTVTGVAAGEAMITVTATDPGGLSATQSYGATVTVPNRAPTPRGVPQEVTEMVGDTVSGIPISTYFVDPDGDSLAFMASSADTAIATVTISGAAMNEMTLIARAEGQTTVTITATDPGGLSATLDIPLRVISGANRAPTPRGVPQEVTEMVGDTMSGIPISTYFVDPDGDSLAFMASSADTAIATVTISGAAMNEMTLIARAEGQTTVTITATDPGGLSAKLDIPLRVIPRANRGPTVVGEIGRQELAPGGMATVDLADVIVDPDGDDLVFTAASRDTTVATVSVTGSVVTVTGVAAGETNVDVTGTDPSNSSGQTQFAVRVVAAAPRVADTIPTLDMLVDSMVPLDMAAYFEGANLTYMAATSDAMVAAATVEGSTVTTMGVAVPREPADTVVTVQLSVTATNDAGSVMQDSIMVRVHREAYDTLPGIVANPDGTVTAVTILGTQTLAACVKSNLTQLAGLPVIEWSEWQRAEGSGWVTVQDNNAFDTINTAFTGGSLCPLALADDAFPPGRYRMVGLVGGSDAAPLRHYRTNVVVKPAG